MLSGSSPGLALWATANFHWWSFPFSSRSHGIRQSVFTQFKMFSKWNYSQPWTITLDYVKRVAQYRTRSSPGNWPAYVTQTDQGTGRKKPLTNDFRGCSRRSERAYCWLFFHKPMWRQCWFPGSRDGPGISTPDGVIRGHSRGHVSSRLKYEYCDNCQREDDNDGLILHFTRFKRDNFVDIK